MTNRQSIEAFNTWRKELPNGHDVPHAIFNHGFPMDVVLQIFQAGWNAARAEARSDASQPSGGRHPGDLREPLTPDSDPNPRLARVNEEGP